MKKRFLVPFILILVLMLSGCGLKPEMVTPDTFKNTMEAASLTVEKHPDYPASETIIESYYVNFGEGHAEYFLLSDIKSARKMYEKYYDIAAEESFAPNSNTEINLNGYERHIESSNFLGHFYSDVLRIDNMVIYIYGENPASTETAMTLIANLGL